MTGWRVTLCGAVGLAALPASLAPATAQTVGTAFGPVVDAGDRSADYRIALVPEEGDQDTAITQRIHVQQALNDTVRLRGILQGSDGDTGAFEFSFFQAELLWQTVEETAGGYSSGFRFDARVNEGDDRAHQLGLNWIHQWSLGEGWRVRALALVDVEAGARARDGIDLETRFQISRRLQNGLRVGVESYNDFGNTDRGLGSFRDQSHAVGPVIGGALGGGVEWFAGPLFGLSDGADDLDLRLHIGRAF